MKIIIKGKKEKGVKAFSYSLILSMGIVIALSAIIPTQVVLISSVAIILTGNFL